jgi:hypothetical protein
MSERSLAHIEKIINIEPIQNADNIELATVLGWKCVVRKGEFQIGDLAAYIEIDSIVPPIPHFNFMKNRNYRVKTIKLRGQISQGILISFKEYVECCKQNQTFDIAVGSWKEKEDVTEYLNITKYESPSDKEQNYIPFQRKKHHWLIKQLTRYQWFRQIFHIKSKSFPEFIPKTYEERIQNIPWILEKFKNEIFYMTEKLDGQSATYWIRKKIFGYEYGICSRTVRKSVLDNSNWSKVFKQLKLKEKLKQLRDMYGYDIAIQGEIIGPNIQGGKYHNSSNKNVQFPLDFFVFNYYDITHKKYIDCLTMENSMYHVNLKTVPYLETFFKLPDNLQTLIKMASGNSVIANIEREGIVIRNLNQTISFKVTNNNFLLKE